MVPRKNRQGSGQIEKFPFFDLYFQYILVRHFRGDGNHSIYPYPGMIETPSAFLVILDISHLRVRAKDTRAEPTHER